MVLQRHRNSSSSLLIVVGLLSFSLTFFTAVPVEGVSTPSQPSESASTSQDSFSPRLLVLLIDSLRWDAHQLYAKRTNHSLPGFAKLISAGGFVDRVRPVFPAECFPNIFSLFSGRYPIEHGAIFNDFYNETDDTAYSFHNWSGDEQLPSLKVERLFSAHMKEKKIRLFNMLPTCSHPVYTDIFCEEVSFVHPSEPQSERLQRTLNRALTGLRNGSTDMAVVYFDELDRIGHLYGPLSNELVLKALHRLDQVIVELIETLDSSSSPINILVTSDHGMTNVHLHKNIDRILSPSMVKKVINRGSLVSIWPSPDEYEKVYSRLTASSRGDFIVYNRTHLPADWHTGGPLFPPLLVVYQPGLLAYSEYWPFAANFQPKGLHGYTSEVPDMHVPLFVYGPHIRAGVHFTAGTRHKPVDHLDTHLLIRHLLGITSTFADNSHDKDALSHQLLMLEPSGGDNKYIWPVEDEDWITQTSYGMWFFKNHLMVKVVAIPFLIILVICCAIAVFYVLVYFRKQSRVFRNESTVMLIDDDMKSTA